MNEYQTKKTEELSRMGWTKSGVMNLRGADPSKDCQLCVMGNKSGMLAYIYPDFVQYC